MIRRRPRPPRSTPSDRRNDPGRAAHLPLHAELVACREIVSAAMQQVAGLHGEIRRRVEEAREQTQFEARAAWRDARGKIARGVAAFDDASIRSIGVAPRSEGILHEQVTQPKPSQS